MSGAGCGAIFRKDQATAAGLCSACGLPEATHLAVILWRAEHPALFREGEGIGSARFLFRGRLIVELGIWRDHGGARLDLAWRTYGLGSQGGALEAIPLDGDFFGQVGWARSYVDGRAIAWEREAREHAGLTVTFADLDRDALARAIVEGVKVAKREREIEAGVHP